jgi:pSer/pThr/pTyr-binding forkhead associated (FHA) protein/AraC-like DNA-binding protein
MAKRSDPADKKPKDGDDRAFKTKTLPEDQRGLWFDHPEAVTMLKVEGSAVSFELQRDQPRFTLGSAPDCDVSVPGEYLSRLHCVIERRNNKLRITDHASKNGLYFNGLRESFCDVRPGDTFTAAPIRFLAMSDAMRAAYPTLVEILGAEEENALHVTETAWTSASAVLVYAMRTTNILITGETGCEQMQLARTIHETSLLRGRPLVEIAEIPTDRRAQREILDRAARTTLVLTIDKTTPVMDAAFVSMVFSPEFHVRVIAIAPSFEKARVVCGERAVSTMHRISLRPLVDRRDMIPRLLDRMFEQSGSPLRFADLTKDNQTALQRHTWPRNLAELRFAAERLAVIAREGSLRKASEALKRHHKSLQEWADTIGLESPLVANR